MCECVSVCLTAKFPAVAGFTEGHPGRKGTAVCVCVSAMCKMRLGTTSINHLSY